jgi:hypothetical protein
MPQASEALLVEHVVVNPLVPPAYLLGTGSCVVGEGLHEPQLVVERAEVVTLR